AAVPDPAAPPPAERAGAGPTVPEAPPAESLELLRRRLDVAALFLEREEYADAFDVLEDVHARLGELAARHPDSPGVRELRQAHDEAVELTRRRCAVARDVALDRGVT